MSEREVSLSEAQERLPELLREIERGDTLAITRNGKQVARLAPPEPNGANLEREETPEEALARRKAAFEDYKREIALLQPKRITIEEILEIIRDSRDWKGVTRSGDLM